MLTAPAVAADAVASGNGGNVALGKNWGPYETYQGSSFRWVANDAEIIARGNGLARLTIACEGGPSLGQTVFPLRVLDASGRQVDHVECGGKSRPATLLLPAQGDQRFLLHVDGGGRTVPNEKRILNFRVFSIDGGGAAANVATGDIIKPQNGVRLGDRWDPIEHFKGQTFRWIAGNDGQVFVTADRDINTTLRLLVDVGPSVGSRATTVKVLDGAQRSVFSAPVKGTQALAVPVHLKVGENPFVIHVADSKSVSVPGDKRILNLRVFNIAALR